MSGGSGPPSREPFATYDPGTSSWRTFRPSATGGGVMTPYSGTWPRSGMTRGGRAYALPKWGGAHHRDRWFCIAVPADAPGVGWPERRAEPEEQQGEVRRVAGDGGQLPAGPRGAVAQDPYGSARDERLGAAPGQTSRGGHGPTLDDEVSFLLPHAHSGGRDGGTGDEPQEGGRDEPADSRHSPAEWWGEYLPAIRRWECLTGVPAPAPTELGPRGGRRLTALFAEWLMGIPGHVTGVPGLTRAQQLHKIGNGAMPQQAYVAYEHLLHQIRKEAA